MDIIVLRNLKVQTTIGVFGWEKKIPQILKISLEIGVDCRHISQNDNLQDTLDYHSVSKSIISFGKENSCALIETFAERLASFLLGQFQMTSLKLQVIKPKAVAEAEEVGVVITRHKA